MKKPLRLLFVSIGLLTLLAPPAARAFIDTTIETDIPFAWRAGEAQLPPGKYRIRPPEDSNGSLLEIQSVGEGGAALIQVFGTEARLPAGDSELVFHKYGDTYYLWRIVEEGSPTGDEVPVARSEKTLRRELSIGERQAEVLRIPARPRAS